MFSLCSTQLGIDGLAVEYVTEPTGQVVLSPLGVCIRGFPMLRAATPQRVRTII